MCTAGTTGGSAAARLPLAHLADHPAAAKALAVALAGVTAAAGVQLPGPLLVLERLDGQKALLVRRLWVLRGASSGRDGGGACCLGRCRCWLPGVRCAAGDEDK